MPLYAELLSWPVLLLQTVTYPKAELNQAERRRPGSQTAKSNQMYEKRLGFAAAARPHSGA